VNHCSNFGQPPAISSPSTARTHVVLAVLEILVEPYLFLLASHAGEFSGKGQLHMRNRAVCEHRPGRGRLPQCSLWVEPGNVPQTPT
jgi:hypothetical protein